MSLFDTILANHHLEKCPLPLWRIKVTDDEYETLKLTLAKETRMIGRMPFMSVTRECTLLYAEYWRREYSEGSHSKQWFSTVCQMRIHTCLLQEKSRYVRTAI
jgi:hypothetical protein